jgi:hypothetical protein
MTKTILVLTFEFGTSEFIQYLACLREAPPCGAEAGAWNLVLPYGDALLACPMRYFSSARFAAIYPVLISIPSLDFSTMH